LNRKLESGHGLKDEFLEMRQNIALTFVIWHEWPNPEGALNRTARSGPFQLIQRAPSGFA